MGKANEHCKSIRSEMDAINRSGSLDKQNGSPTHSDLAHVKAKANLKFKLKSSMSKYIDEISESKKDNHIKTEDNVNDSGQYFESKGKKEHAKALNNSEIVKDELQETKHKKNKKEKKNKKSKKEKR